MRFADDAKLAALRAQVHAELAASPRARPWWVGALVLMAFNLVAAACAVLTLSSNAAFAKNPAARLAITMGLLLVMGAGALLGLRPGRQAPRVAMVAVTASVLALAWLMNSGSRLEGPFWAGTSCAATEGLVSLVPLMTGLVLLTRFGFDPLRTVVIGISTAGVGLLALHLHCPNGAWEHLATFHALPWAMMIAVLFVVRRALPSKTFAP